MLDLKSLRTDARPFRVAMDSRGIGQKPLDEIIQLDVDWRKMKKEADDLKAERNKLSIEISEDQKAGRDTRDKITLTQAISGKIKALDEELAAIEKKMEGVLLVMPNVPHASVPAGPDEGSNVEVRKWGQPAKTSKDVLPHYVWGEKAGLIDFERGAKLSGSRFAVLKGEVARLERALVNFMLETHISRGYKEVAPPYLVSGKTMAGTGQLPKFAEELYKIAEDGLYLIPTAEVPVANLHAGEILEEKNLPLNYTAYTPCFRREAGNYQKDIKGLIRQHQFDKVELVKITAPEKSWEEHEKLTKDAEHILQQLGLPYRTIVLCTGDMGFASAKTYDIEVWLPSQDKYREISSCSNCTDFQARRMNTKYWKEGKPEFVHTLNGSGLAVGRAAIAIIENFQDADGNVDIPKVLRDFMMADEIRMKK